MAKRMLIDAAHPEETRVAVLSGNRLEEFDFESSTKRQVKGNIYLAKVTRVEPSLQAAFVDYGGNRHGFLAFSEIHPDYYRIPVGDRPPLSGDSVRPETPQPLAGAFDTGAETAEEMGVPLEAALPEPVAVRELPDGGEGGDGADAAEAGADAAEPSWKTTENRSDAVYERTLEPETDAPLWDDFVTDEPTPPDTESDAAPEPAEPLPPLDTTIAEPVPSPLPFEAAQPGEPGSGPDDDAAAPEIWENEAAEQNEALPPSAEAGEGAEPIETIGGDDFDEAQRHDARVSRHYKIQEVIKRRQIMLVQVAKEERGTKGAALTTYLSLAGRYCVLMPNTARGGGVSRKITNIGDRRRLKEVLEELDLPEGMGVIVRTAGAERSKAEIRRDYEYLLRLWNEIRDLTLRSTAPALIYEEGNLIKRSIRDLYTRDIDDVLVEGEEGYRTAKAFMKMLMPSHAKRVQPYRESQTGLFHRFQVEGQIDAIHAPSVQLRSGGYIVINQTEALVAIDVNSGRSTRERNIEETALRTNLEAAEEIARQLRLRDLAGLIVIDFIDMEEHRNQAAVERRLKETLKYDRARIQVGRISPFGLLEMSRQRLRPSLAEASTQPCPHCGGTGFIRSTESTALHVLRSIEEEGMRRRAAEICVYVPTTVALYILNHKRETLAQLEARYGLHVLVARDDVLIPPAFRLERLRAFGPAEIAAPAPLTQAVAEEEDAEDEEAADAADTADAEAAEPEAGEERRRRSRRRRRRRHDGETAAGPDEFEDEAHEEFGEPAGEATTEPAGAAARDGNGDDDADRHRRRRGRRGGRRRLRQPGGARPSFPELPPAAETVEVLPTLAAVEEPDDRASTRPVTPPAWEPETLAETGAEPAAAGVETASLPALAGDDDVAGVAAATSEHGPAPKPEQDLPPDGPPAVETIEIVENSSFERDVPAPESAEREVWRQTGNGTAEEDAAPGAPDAAAPEAPPPQSPAIPVQSVTEKPANPRRGWWQRLIQP
jgi:ribonuclease E